MALSAATALQTRNRAGMTRRSFVVLTSAVVYHHSLQTLTAAGLLKPAANETTTTFAGLADCPNGTITGDGTLRVECLNDMEVLLPLTILTVAQTNATAVYAYDDERVTSDATLGPVVGVMTQLESASTAWIRLRGNTIAVAS